MMLRLRTYSPSLRANGSSECAPDATLREAIHALSERETEDAMTAGGADSLNRSPMFGAQCAARADLPR
jgi:hypothetical protein